jgi:hypothetical protein
MPESGHHKPHRRASASPAVYMIELVKKCRGGAAVTLAATEERQAECVSDRYTVVQAVPCHGVRSAALGWIDRASGSGSGQLPNQM